MTTLTDAEFKKVVALLLGKRGEFDTQWTLYLAEDGTRLLHCQRIPIMAYFQPTDTVYMYSSSSSEERIIARATSKQVVVLLPHEMSAVFTHGVTHMLAAKLSGNWE